VRDNLSIKTFSPILLPEITFPSRTNHPILVTINLVPLHNPNFWSIFPNYMTGTPTFNLCLWFGIPDALIVFRNLGVWTSLTTSTFGMYLFFLSTSVITSQNVRSNASKQCMCIIGASSHIISFALITNNAKGVPGSIPHVEDSSMIIGMPNLECAVLPLYKQCNYSTGCNN
jgi:hypothetical protein